MAAVIQHGGTNGVEVLDMGLPGGTLHAGWPETGAYATMEIVEGPTQSPATQAAMPQSDFVAVQRGGFHGKVLSASGLIQAIDHDTLNGIIAAIEARENDPDKSKPTRYQNSVTGHDYPEVIVRNFRHTGPREVAVAGVIVLEYQLEFHVLREGVAP